MADDLVKAADSSLAAKLEPTVHTLARPTAHSLIQARADVQRDVECQALFREAKDHSASWLADNLAARLGGLWGQDFGEALEASRYLADEYHQLGEGILIVSSESGRAIAKLDEKDLFQPAPVLRESGEIAVPLPRIEPGLEANLVAWVFEKGREERLVEALAARANQTALLREEGDRRLWIATRKGRARMARALADDHPKVLLERAGGTSGAFLRHFDIAFEPPEGIEGFRCTLTTISAIQVNDPLTTNLQYDRLGALRGVIPQGWVRDLAKQIAQARLRRGHHNLDIESLKASDFGGHETWVTDPEVMLHILRRENLRTTFLPVDGSPTIGLTGKVGTIVVPEKVDLSSREIFGRWDILASLKNLDVFIHDWQSIACWKIGGLSYQAEVVR